MGGWWFLILWLAVALAIRSQTKSWVYVVGGGFISSLVVISIYAAYFIQPKSPPPTTAKVATSKPKPNVVKKAATKHVKATGISAAKLYSIAVSMGDNAIAAKQLRISYSNLSQSGVKRVYGKKDIIVGKVQEVSLNVWGKPQVILEAGRHSETVSAWWSSKQSIDQTPGLANIKKGDGVALSCEEVRRWNATDKILTLGDCAVLRHDKP